MGFVGNYAPCGLSPQTDGMPVILKKERQQLSKADPKPVKTVFLSGRRPVRRLDDGGRIAGKHQPGLIQRHRSGK